jgi:hypothetical protein
MPRSSSGTCLTSHSVEHREGKSKVYLRCFGMFEPVINMKPDLLSRASILYSSRVADFLPMFTSLAPTVLCMAPQAI